MKLRPFELMLIVGFAVLALVAITMLSLYKPADDPEKDNLAGAVSIWGTLPEAPMTDLLASLSKNTPSLGEVTYRYVEPKAFDSELVTALADRTGPDLILISHEELITQRARLQPFSEKALSLRDFKDRYIDGGEVFVLKDGVYALPLAVDPLVLYWNRNLLQNAGFLTAPATWEQLVNDVAPKLTVKDYDRTIKRAVVAMGEVDNIAHVHPIISMLMLQSGSKLVTETDRGYLVQINQGVTESEPLTRSLGFFMNFSNPANTLYSWNRSLTLDRDMFVSEDLALYFGFGSEARDLGSRNPNLNYDIAEVPQGAASTVRRTYGRMYGMGVLRNANNLPGAYTVLEILANPENAATIAQTHNLAPAGRAALGAGTNDVYGRVVYSSAVAARGWLSPGIDATDRVFERMINTAGADRVNAFSAASDAVSRLSEEY